MCNWFTLLPIGSFTPPYTPAQRVSYMHGYARSSKLHNGYKIIPIQKTSYTLVSNLFGGYSNGSHIRVTVTIVYRKRKIDFQFRLWYADAGTFPTEIGDNIMAPTDKPPVNKPAGKADANISDAQNKKEQGTQMKADVDAITGQPITSESGSAQGAIHKSDVVVEPKTVGSGNNAEAQAAFDKEHPTDKTNPAAGTIVGSKGAPVDQHPPQLGKEFVQNPIPTMLGHSGNEPGNALPAGVAELKPGPTGDFTKDPKNAFQTDINAIDAKLVRGDITPRGVKVMGELRVILKEGGLDSQQLEKALARIEHLLKDNVVWSE